MVAKAAHTKGVEMIDYLFPLRTIPRARVRNRLCCSP